MKNAALFVLAAVTAIIVTGCASQHASVDSGKVRTAYTVPADESAPAESTVWALSPTVSP